MLNNEAPGANVNALTSDGLVANAVKQDPNAIGYFGLAWQGSKAFHSTKVNGVPCAPGPIKKFKYPLSRYIFMVLPAAPEPRGDEIHRLGAEGPGGREIINKSGGVAAFNKAPKKK